MSNDDEPIKKNIQIELEIDANTKTHTNKFQTLIDLAETIDAWRIFPRLFIISYIYVVIRTMEWFWALKDPTTQQASIISMVLGVGAAWFHSYVNSGKKSSNNSELIK